MKIFFLGPRYRELRYSLKMQNDLLMHREGLKGNTQMRIIYKKDMMFKDHNIPVYTDIV